MNLFRRIVHANDGSENSLAALGTALDLAAANGSTLDVILVDEASSRPGDADDASAGPRPIDQRRMLVERIAGRKGVAPRIHIFTARPVEQIVEFVREHDADLLVIGATAHIDLWERLFGRRSDRMTHKVDCSVLIVRARGHGLA